jgi:hypothetical protein
VSLLNVATNSINSSKFGRAYDLQVQKVDGTFLTINLPFTIEFDVTRNTLSSANVCQIRIYNLSLANRNAIRHNATDYGIPYQSIVLRAGYGNNLPVIFSGNISQAWSVREGVNFITQIECYDAGFAYVNGTTNISFPAGTPTQAIIASLAGSLPYTDVGSIGNYVGYTGRGSTYSGNTMSILSDLTGGGVFIDNGSVNCLGTNEYIDAPGGVTVINSSSGLLATPVLENTIVRFDIIFEPTLHTGQSVLLESLTDNTFSGLYKIIGVKHRGMISDAVCGSVITTGEFFYNNPLIGVEAFG